MFYEAALVRGSFDEAKFKKKSSDEKVRRSKLQTWFLLVTEPEQSALDWIRFY